MKTSPGYVFTDCCGITYNRSADFLPNSPTIDAQVESSAPSVSRTSASRNKTKLANAEVSYAGLLINLKNRCQFLCCNLRASTLHSVRRLDQWRQNVMSKKTGKRTQTRKQKSKRRRKSDNISGQTNQPFEQDPKRRIGQYQGKGEPPLMKK